MKYFKELEIDAINRNIPIMQREGLEFMINIFNENNCHSCLEIGYKIANDTIYLISYPSSSINNSRKKQIYQ